ncbi:UNVERIFIED_CONTAM: hypothetical protein FKN15_049095 [Acipenser sinensis]
MGRSLLVYKGCHSVSVGPSGGNTKPGLLSRVFIFVCWCSTCLCFVYRQDRGRTPRSCRTTASTSHLGHHTPRTTELDTSPPEHLHFSPPHKSTQRAERDLLDWDL